MNEVNHKGEVSSFWELLKINKIEIPIIQRDYAQGREDKKEIRDNFLNALFDSINSDHPIKLDFIYGNLENGVSRPLDGQQRLTTLFLLHWYAAAKGFFLKNEVIQIFQTFTYETRVSSREFCNELVSNEIEIKKETVPSVEIINSSWFFLSWKKDPTIDAMLRTIDNIHDVFFDVDDLWEKLTKNDPLIGFYHIDLEGIGLTDDLYIKMNARGKLLSPFENFKALFQQIINENKWDEGNGFLNSFAYKIDTIWTDLFWNKSKSNIDNAFIRFISTVVMCRKSIIRSENRFSIISELQEQPSLVKPNLFDESDFKYLCSILDIYSEILDKKEDGLTDLKLNFPLFQHSPLDSIFTSIVYEGYNASYTQKALFYAQTEYLLHNSFFNKEMFTDWMRVVRNILSRGDVVKTGTRPAIIRSPQTFDGVINLIQELSIGSNNIYSYLSSAKIKSSFSKEQVEEEILKANLIMNDYKNKISIFKVEDTNLLQGKISFALYCIDYENVYNFKKDELLEVQSILNQYFNEDSDISNDLRRALLTISNEVGSYSYYEYWWSFWNVVSADKRCLLDGSLRALEFYIYGNNGDYRIYLKKLIKALFNNTLVEISSNFSPPKEMSNWKVRLIKEHDLLDNRCHSNHIAIPVDESCCYLLKSMRPRDIEGCEKID
jgi:hypothetical protein